ncbi:MAG TPA: family 16 glycosylhydrolase [Saprospiraceae bacterium]|nr:family 16 glycosylhydrolase [Saprospiraceae bacterium]
MKILQMSYFSNKILLLTFLLTTVCFSACIKEDDGTPAPLNLPSITFEDLTVEEGDVDAVVELEVTLSGENKTNAIVTFSAISGSAESGIDFEILTTGRLIFAPGETKKVIEINITGDEAKEIKETFEIKFYSPQNVKLAKDLATITIEDDDNNTSGIDIPSTGYVSADAYPGYNLVWADEFDGTALNTANWTYEMGDGCPNNCGWGNNELQYYRADNTSIVNGNLVITAKKQNFGTRNYTSSRLVTKGKKQFKFGRIDIRAALPEGKGLWPALWMLGSNIDAVSWPACGEIDIMELTGDLPNRVVGTVHYGANVSQHQYKSMSKYLSGTDNFQDEFHVFSINWEADLIQFLVDDEVYHTITPASLNGAPYPFNKNFFFIFNVAVGGNFPGNPDNSTPFPQHMIVDYVRVFQK